MSGSDDADVEMELDSSIAYLGTTEADLLNEPEDEEAEELDILDLENKVPHRARRRVVKKSVEADTKDEANDSEPVEAPEEIQESTARPRGAVVDGKKRRAAKRPERIMLRRTKLREQYLQKLAAEGKIHADRPPKPDPERWLPRKQRSYNKRGKRRNQFLGAQGSGDGAQKDAAKLDVAARVAERREKGIESAKEAKSSAQATVSSSSGRRTKKRGKRK